MEHQPTRKPPPLAPKLAAPAPDPAHDKAPPPSPAGPSAAPEPPGRAHWTPGKQRIFLAALLDSGCVARAARAAGMSRSSAHRLRSRLAGTPFDRVWDQALALHARRMADPFAPDPFSAPPVAARTPS